MPPQTTSDRMLSALRNNRFVAVLIVGAAIVGGVATFTNAVSTAIQFVKGIGGDSHRPLYRALADNLDNLERTVGNIAILKNLDLGTEASLVSDDIGEVEQAAKPVCDSRDRVSELGDKELRHDLDMICADVVTMRRIAADGRQKDAVGVAPTLDGLIKMARAKLNSRT
jgi:hypothetical protein